MFWLHQQGCRTSAALRFRGLAIRSGATVGTEVHPRPSSERALARSQNGWRNRAQRSCLFSTQPARRPSGREVRRPSPASARGSSATEPGWWSFCARHEGLDGCVVEVGDKRAHRDGRGLASSRRTLSHYAPRRDNARAGGMALCGDSSALPQTPKGAHSKHGANHRMIRTKEDFAKGVPRAGPESFRPPDCDRQHSDLPSANPCGAVGADANTTTGPAFCDGTFPRAVGLNKPGREEVYPSSGRFRFALASARPSEAPNGREVDEELRCSLLCPSVLFQTRSWCRPSANLP